MIVESLIKYKYVELNSMYDYFALNLIIGALFPRMVACIVCTQEIQPKTAPASFFAITDLFLALCLWLICIVNKRTDR